MKRQLKQLVCSLTEAQIQEMLRLKQGEALASELGKEKEELLTRLKAIKKEIRDLKRGKIKVAGLKRASRKPRRKKGRKGRPGRKPAVKKAVAIKAVKGRGRRRSKIGVAAVIVEILSKAAKPMNVQGIYEALPSTNYVPPNNVPKKIKHLIGVTLRRDKSIKRVGRGLFTVTR